MFINCSKLKFENRSKAVNRVRKRGCQLRVKEAVKTYEIGLKRGREKRAFKGTKSVQNRRSKIVKIFRQDFRQKIGLKNVQKGAVKIRVIFSSFKRGRENV